MHIRRKPKPKGVIRASGGFQGFLGTHIKSYMAYGRLYLRNADGTGCTDRRLRIHGHHELSWSDLDLWDFLPDERCEVEEAGEGVWRVKV